MSVAKLELNILTSGSQAIDIGSAAQCEVALLVTDDARRFELKASQGLDSFLFVDAEWESCKESLRATLGKFDTKPNVLIYADDIELAHFLGLLGVPKVVTAAALWDLIFSGSFAEKFRDKSHPPFSK